MKTVYETPQVVELGSFEQMTQARTSGRVLDSNQPSGAVPTLTS